MLPIPNVLAQLPRPPSQEQCSIFTAEVFGVLGNDKKKRSEVVAAIDCEGINIYEVRSSKLVASYAVSSESTFTCPPCSIRQKKFQDSPNRRLTYCSIGGPKPRIQCFAETSIGRFQASGRVSTTSLQISAATSEVIFIETIEGHQSDSGYYELALLVIHKDGEIRCLSEDLSAQHWTWKPPPSDEAARNARVSVCTASLLSVDQARKGLLKNREDILATIDTSIGLEEPKYSSPDLLMLVTKPAEGQSKATSGTLTVQLYSVRGTKQSVPPIASLGKHAVTSLLSLSIQDSESHRKTDYCYFIHKPSGALYQYRKRSLLIYDLTGSIPRVEYRVVLEDKIASCIRLSSTSVLLTSSSSISILDTRYSSLLATGSVKINVQGENNSSLKGKEKTRLISYFSPLDTVVGLQGRNLVTFQITDSRASETKGRKRNRHGTLIDAIGHGIGASSSSYGDAVKLNLPTVLGKQLPQDESKHTWDSAKANLDTAFEAGDTDAFDKILAIELNKGSMVKEPVMPDRYKAAFVFNKIFLFKSQGTPTNSSNDRPEALHVQFFPTRAFQWLARTGALNIHQVETALKQSGALPITQDLPTCAVVHALATHDPSLNSLMALLASPCLLMPREIVYAIQAALGVIQQSENLADIRLISTEEADLQEDSDEEMDIDNGNAKQRSVSPEENADKVHDAHAAMATSLARLNRCHVVDIRKALKQELSKKDIMAFIDYLRMELASGGWLSRYIDDNSPVEDQSQRSDQISIVAKLLNCAIDSLGAGAWLLGSSNGIDTTDNADTISYMKAEISAALEGIEEAAYLQGILHEILLYGKSVPSVPSHESRFHTKKVKPITVELDDKDAHQLPIGLKAPNQHVAMRKIGAGGEIQARSMRDVGRLKSQKVGKYSFERILL